MLFWEVLQWNKRFRSFLTETERAHDFIVLVLFYAIEQKQDPSKQGLVRMCIFVLQTMSAEPNFGKSLNKKFEAQETLPACIRIPNFHGTYADFLITVWTSSHRIFPTLLISELISLVDLVLTHYQQGQVGDNLPSFTRDNQQHCAIRRKSWTRHMLEAASAFRVDVISEIPVCK